MIAVHEVHSAQLPSFWTSLVVSSRLALSPGHSAGRACAKLCRRLSTVRNPLGDWPGSDEGGPRNLVVGAAKLQTNAASRAETAHLIEGWPHL